LLLDLLRRLRLLRVQLLELRFGLQKVTSLAVLIKV